MQAEKVLTSSGGVRVLELNWFSAVIYICSFNTYLQKSCYYESKQLVSPMEN